MSRVVRPSFRDPRFGLLVAGETVNSIGGWASAIVLWGFAAYRFNAGPDAVAVTIVCWAAPPAVLSPLMGVYIDRAGPRAALVAYAGAFLWGVAGSVFGAVSLTTLQQVAPVHAHGRVISVTATLQSWVETLALPLGGVTLATAGVRAGALVLAGVAVTAGLAGLAKTWPPG
jgi:hypothetical protein